MKLNYKATPSITSPTSFQIAEEEWTTGDYDYASELARQYKTSIIETREKAIREGLIALGWTPPQENIK